MSAVDARIANVRDELRSDMIEIAKVCAAAVEAVDVAIDGLRDAARGPDVVAQIDELFDASEKALDDTLAWRKSLANR